MKSLLIGFFQVLCFLQVFGHSQLNAYPTDKTNSYSSTSIIQFYQTEQKASHIGPFRHDSNSAIKTNSSIPFEDAEMIFESLEEETEDFSSGKHLYNNLYFTGIPVDQSLDYLYGNSRNSLMFCEQSSFILANKRHVVFQVFRI